MKEIIFGLILWSLLSLLILLALPEAIEADKGDWLQRARESIQRQMENDIRAIKEYGNYKGNHR